MGVATKIEEGKSHGKHAELWHQTYGDIDQEVLTVWEPIGVEKVSDGRTQIATLPELLPTTI